jgi:hypothetical protein
MTNGVYLGSDVLPIFVVTEPGTLTRALFQGTGFLIAQDILITCWHCVSQALEDGQRYAAVVKEGDGHTVHVLRNMEQHPLGLDLAIARVDLVPKVGLTLTATGLLPGDDIVTYGYPPTDEPLMEDEHAKVQLNARLLRGYVTRLCYYNQPGFVRTPSYELDIPAPHGLSGAPIIKLKTKEVAGVFFASLDVSTGEQFPAVAGHEGDQQAEIDRAVSFGLAHYTGSVWSLRGMITQGIPLREFLELRSEVDTKIAAGVDISEQLVTEPAEELPSVHKRPNAQRLVSGFSAEALRISADIASLGRRGKHAPAAGTPRYEKTGAATEMEELQRRLERYEARLAPEFLERLREERRIVEELRSMYPGKRSDSTP